MRYRRTERGDLAEVSPERCSKGHALGPLLVIVGFLPCSCSGSGGHRTYRCRTCGVVDYDPPHDGEAEMIVGFGRE